MFLFLDTATTDAAFPQPEMDGRYDTYARGLEEAAGHVEARKSEYRRVSQEWHQFLGFSPCSLPSRKRPVEDIANQADNRSKRLRSNDYTI